MAIEKPGATQRRPDVAVLRSGFARGLGAVLVGGGAAGIAVLAVTGGAVEVVTYGGFLFAVGALGYVAYWKPHVVLDDDGVLIVNPLRSVRLGWTQIVEVDGRYGLRLLSEQDRYDAWGVPAPGGIQRARHSSSVVAASVQRRWERARIHAERDSRETTVPAPRWQADPVARALLGLAVALALGCALLVGLG